MKVTAITAQQKNPNRVNISIDGSYRFSLDIYQLSELNVKLGQSYSESELHSIEQESSFGKLYARSLEYCLSRPHSAREVREYLRRKTRETTYKARDGSIKKREGAPLSHAERVFRRLEQKGYIDDERFARFWVESRHQSKGASQRKLVAELRLKGVEQAYIDAALNATDRNDDDELAKVIAKKRSRYSDSSKLMAYLARQGFRYDDIKAALDESEP